MWVEYNPNPMVLMQEAEAAAQDVTAWEGMLRLATHAIMTW